MSIFMNQFGYLLVTTAIVLSGIWVRRALKTSGPGRRRKFDSPERVVILGASSGIGYEMALEYARRGCILVLTARRKSQLDQLALACERLNPQTKCLVIPGDLTSPEFLNLLVKDIQSSSLFHPSQPGVVPSIDTLVICAGSLSVLSFEDIIQQEKVEQAMSSIFDLNVYMPIRAAATFLPLLKRTKLSENKEFATSETESRIVVVSSVAGVIGAPTRSLYAATKHAVQGFFNSIRVEWRQYGIGITIALPGSVDTELRSKAVDTAGPTPVTPATQGKRKDGAISPVQCAKRIVEAAGRGDRDVYVPTYYRWAHLLSLLAPGFIDNKAAKKYNF